MKRPAIAELRFADNSLLVRDSIGIGLFQSRIADVRCAEVDPPTPRASRLEPREDVRLGAGPGVADDGAGVVDGARLSVGKARLGERRIPHSAIRAVRPGD